MWGGCVSVMCDNLSSGCVSAGVLLLAKVFLVMRAALTSWLLDWCELSFASGKGYVCVRTLQDTWTMAGHGPSCMHCFYCNVCGHVCSVGRYDAVLSGLQCH